MRKRGIMACLILLTATLVFAGPALADQALQIKNMSGEVFTLQYVTCEGSRMGSLECTYTPGSPTAQFGDTVTQNALVDANGYVSGPMDPTTFERAKYYFGFMIRLQNGASTDLTLRQGSATKGTGKATVSKIPDIQGKKAWKIEITMTVY
jgi:hypothetical protein